MPSYGYRQNYGDLFFTPTYNQPVAPIDLEQLATSYDTLQKRHDTAVTTLSAYKTALAELDLNPAESEYVNNLAAGLDKSLTDNANYNNLGFGLNALIKQYGDVMSNQGLRGRLDAQKNYKTYLANLEANKTLDEDTKAYYREHNKYYYNPQFDEQGREIKGSEWQPIERETDTINTTALMIQAMQMAAKDSGGGDTVYFKDANGQWTTNIDASADGMPYYKTHGTYEKLTKEKLKAAYETVIANTPGAMASLEQDYKVQNWKYDKNGDIGVGPTTDEKGVKLNFKQYLDKRFDGFYQSATYTKYTNTFTPLTGLSLEAAKARTAAKQTSDIGGGSIDDFIKNAQITTPGAYVQEKGTPLSAVIGTVQASTDKLRNIAQQNNIPFNLSNIDESFNNIVSFYRNNGQKLPDDIYDAYVEYTTNNRKFEQLIPASASDDVKQRLQIISALAVGADLGNLLDENGNLNKYVKEYSQIINNIWGTNDKYVFPMSQYAVQKFVDENKDYADLGLNLETINGIQKLTMTHENADKLYLANERLYNYYTLLSGMGIPQPLQRVKQLYDTVNAPIEDISVNQQTLIPTEIVSSIDVLEDAAMYDYNLGKFSDYKSAKDWWDNRFYNDVRSGLRNAHGERINMGFGFDNKPMDYNNTGDERNAILSILRLAVNETENLVGFGWDKNSGRNTMQITFNDKLLKDTRVQKLIEAAGGDPDKIQTLNVICDDLYNNATKRALISSKDFGISKQLNDDIAAGVKEFSNIDGSTLYTDGSGNFVLNKDGISQVINYAEAKKTQLANSYFYDLVKIYGNIMQGRNRNDFPAEFANSFNARILDMIKMLSPQDASATSVNELSPTGKLIRQDILQKLVDETDKIY